MEKDGHNDHQALFVMGASFKETDLGLKNTEVQQCLQEQTLRLKAGGCQVTLPHRAESSLSSLLLLYPRMGGPYSAAHKKCRLLEGSSSHGRGVGRR